MLVKYTSRNEVIITTTEQEAETLLDYFPEGSPDRKLEDYKRYESDNCCVWVISQVLSGDL